MRNFNKKPTDEFVTCYDTMFDDSLIAMAKCLAASAKERIINEVNDYYPNAEIIAKEGKYLADVISLMDLMSDYIKANGPYGSDSDFEYFEKQLKEHSKFIIEDAGGDMGLRLMLHNMFSECKLRSRWIEDIIELLSQ